mgnify:FL=1
MATNRWVLPAAVLVGAAVAWFFFLRSSEENRIRERFAELEEIASRPPSAGLLGKAEVIGRFRELFADPVALETPRAPVSGIRSPDELAATYLSLVEAGSSFELSIDPGPIEFPSDDVARAEAKIDARVTRPGGRTRSETGSVLAELRKTEGDWKFALFREE